MEAISLADLTEKERRSISAALDVTAALQDKLGYPEQAQTLLALGLKVMGPLAWEEMRPRGS